MLVCVILLFNKISDGWKQASTINLNLCFRIFFLKQLGN
ncbi:hypothetical protein COO91_04732 [Nostoc flagelliforme CCNUN1]|uniref:Uncharacterized protein n=1 Tax=Nostoc flagelliforme CCNUN1 TaxID=2038116 RepID=A0A2K8STL2_9NOSO|nr:hypothetical protein COO91_04732 [Nostoc flagelliforme CCNUN1]